MEFANLVSSIALIYSTVLERQLCFDCFIPGVVGRYNAYILEASNSRSYIKKKRVHTIFHAHQNGNDWPGAFSRKIAEQTMERSLLDPRIPLSLFVFFTIKAWPILLLGRQLQASSL